jgi:hypothetical protein
MMTLKFNPNLKNKNKRKRKRKNNNQNKPEESLSPKTYPKYQSPPKLQSHIP